jgi:hypothetical protein
MIFGDRTQLAFEVNPVEPSWERRSPVDRGPWALLSVWVKHRNLTRAVDEASDIVTNGVAVPLATLARWMVQNARGIVFEEVPAVAKKYGVEPHEVLDRWNDADAPPGIPQDDWEDARYDWYCRHFWMAGSDGAMLPDVGLTRADGDLFMSWRHSRFPGPKRLMFLEHPGVERVEWAKAWEAMRDYVGWVASEVKRLGVDEFRWAFESSPLDDAAHCTPAQFIELVAPEANELLDYLRINPEEDPEGRPSLLALRDLDVIPDTFNSVAESTIWIDEQTNTAERGERLWDLRSRAKTALGAPKPENAGYDAARWLRSERNLDGQPIATDGLRSILSDLAVTEEISATSVVNSAVIGARQGHGGAVVLIRHARTRAPWAERMELARAIGHLLLDPLSARGAAGAASSLVASGPRRCRSGAFAAELLLPSQHLLALANAGESPASPPTFEGLMARFEVGARTAAYHLWNHNLLMSEEERDWLIEEFGRATSEQSEIG